MLQEALQLAAAGLAVFPLQPRAKIPYKGTHGLKDATTDPVQITAWWTSSPDSNIGIRTGEISGVIVVDLDGPTAGEHLVLPPTLAVKTGKGKHLYYRWPTGVNLRNTAGVHGPKVDTRANDGYVLAPPSVHPDGSIYTWLGGELAPAPAWLSGAGLVLDVAPPPKTLDEWRDYLQVCPAGTKHVALRDASYAYACRAHEDGADRVDALAKTWEMLQVALAQNPSPVADWRAAQKVVETAFDRAYERVLAAPPPVAAGAAVGLMAPQYRTWDLGGLAGRFALEYVDAARFVEGQGWYTWDGRRWCSHSTSYRPTELVFAMLERMAATLPGDFEDREKTQKFLLSLRKDAAKIASLAANLMMLPSSALNSHPTALNCLNGILDLTSGALHPHAPRAYLTQLVPFAWDPLASAPRWALVLSQVTGGDTALQTYLQAMFGSFMHGITEDSVHILMGGGNNGKSLVLEAVAGVLGSYAGSAHHALICEAKNGNGPHSSAAGRLRGKRMIVIDDQIPEERPIEMAAIKAYFGRTTVNAQMGMGKDFEDFTPTAKLLLTCNHMPRIKDTSAGALRRLRIVPFSVDQRTLGIPRDDSFGAALVAQEGPGILRWLVEGHLRWRALGMPECAAVTAGTDEVSLENDTFAQFLADTYEPHNGEALVLRSEVHTAYRQWSEARGERWMSATQVNGKMRSKGYVEHKKHGGRMWLGLKRKPADMSKVGPLSN